MNSKMITAHNYQQLNLGGKKKTTTKQTTRTGTESQIWRSGRVISQDRRRKGQNESKGVGIIELQIGSHKIDTGRLRTVQEMEQPENLYVRPMGMTLTGDAGGNGGSQVEAGAKGEKLG